MWYLCTPSLGLGHRPRLWNARTLCQPCQKTTTIARQSVTSPVVCVLSHKVSSPSHQEVDPPTLFNRSSLTFAGLALPPFTPRIGYDNSIFTITSHTAHLQFSLPVAQVEVVSVELMCARLTFMHIHRRRNRFGVF